MISGLRTIAALRDALDAEGLVRESGYNGAEMRGWIAPNISGSTGFSIRPVTAETLEWHIVLSGKRHLPYGTSRDGYDGDESHYPVNPERLHRRIKDCFSSIGLSVDEISPTDWQTMWDDDIGYTIRTAAPEWLERPDPDNQWRFPKGAFTLVALEVDRSVGLPRGRTIIGYANAGQFWITGESIEDLSDLLKQRPQPKFGGIHQRGSWSSDLADPDRIPGRPSRLITNFWGDEVRVWPLNDTRMRIDPRFRPDVPFLLGGAMRREASFAEVDGQFGDGAPWHAADPAPRGP